MILTPTMVARGEAVRFMVIGQPLCISQEVDIMLDNEMNFELSASFLKQFLKSLTVAEEELRDVEDSIGIINGLLESTCKFYDADRAYILEADWALGTGTNTYEYCAEGVEPQIDVVQQVPMEVVPHWKNVFLSNQPMIIPDVEAIKDIYPDEYEILSVQGIHSVLATPFSKRINTGYIGVDNPRKYTDNPTYLLIITYAIVAELNEIKLERSIDLANKHVTQHRDKDVFINCFGGLEIVGAKGTIYDDDISDQCCCLLIYLILNNKHLRPIRELAEVLWPEAQISDPYHDVKNVVYRLKRTLGLINLEDLIIASNGTFILNPEYEIRTDFERFEDACLRVADEQNAEMRSSMYHTAIALYRGSLLPRFDHEYWVMPKATYYQNLYMRLLKGYIAYKFEINEFALAQRAAVDGLTVDPYDTELMVALIISMCKQGNHGVARGYYNKIRSELTEEQEKTVQEHLKKPQR